MDQFNEQIHRTKQCITHAYHCKQNFDSFRSHVLSVYKRTLGECIILDIWRFHHGKFESFLCSGALSGVTSPWRW